MLLGISRAAAYREMKKMQDVVIGQRSLRVTEAAVESEVRQRGQPLHRIVLLSSFPA